MTAIRPARKLLASAIAIAFTTLAPAASAQQAPTDTKPASQGEPVRLDAITVTAQKREEALQDVPVVVTALSEETLRDTGVRDIKDLQVLVPGLIVTSTQNEAITTARIRGIGTVGDNVGLESSVGVVIDGVYRPRNSVGFGDLGELERIEVLKGPQGTLFGKNTSAGVINVVTRKPSHELSAEVEFTVGNFGAYGISAAINGPLDEGAALRVYAARRTRDGYMDVRRGVGPRGTDDDYDQGFGTVRASLLLEPADNLTFLVAGDYTSREENCCTAAQVVVGSTSRIINRLAGGDGIAGAGATTFPAAGDPFARVAWSNRDTEQDIKDKGLSVQADWNAPWLGGSTLTVISAVRDWQSINGIDFDFTGADLLYRNPSEDDNFSRFETMSHEVRLTGASERFDWLFGGFYSREDLTRNEAYRIGTAYEPYLSIGLLGQVNPALAARPDAPLLYSRATGLAPGTVFAGHGAADKYEQNATSAALFTNDTWHATDALDLTLGLRYTREQKKLDARYSNPNGGAGCAALLSNPARIATALASYGLPASPALIGQIVSFGCLPWSNSLHNGRASHQEREEKEWSGTLKAAYRWNEHWMTYASAARGYKAGGFNLDRTQAAVGANPLPITPTTADTSFPGEFVDSYELGAKTTWLDGNLLLNATLFHQTYEDFQLNSFLGTSFVVRSIPEVVSKGVDAEILWQSGGWMLQGGLTYADTQYGDERPTPEFLDAAPPATPGALYKLPGSQASFAPKLSATASVGYDWEFDRYVARFHVGAKYLSKYNTGSDLDAEKLQDAYTVANARIGFGRRDQRWMVELWGQNITDAEYMQVAFDAPLQALGGPRPGGNNTYNAFLGAPRMYGVTLRLSY
jgi:iron complex outermembrane recepter protein